MRPLRGLQGLRPYAVLKTLGPSALADGGYPKGGNLHGPAKITSFRALNEIEYVSARAAPKALPDFSLWLKVKRRVPLGMERAQANVLTP